MRAHRFQMYDEGPSVQVGIGHLPPAYPLHQITTPIALFDGTSDSLQDASLRHLPAVLAKYSVEGYEHLDFLWAESVHRKVWPLIVRLLNRVQIQPPQSRSDPSDLSLEKLRQLIHSDNKMSEEIEKFLFSENKLCSDMKVRRSRSNQRLLSPPSSD